MQPTGVANATIDVAKALYESPNQMRANLLIPFTKNGYAIPSNVYGIKIGKNSSVSSVTK